MKNIDEKSYEYLLARSHLLRLLFESGVDNWSGYYYVQEQMEEEHSVDVFELLHNDKLVYLNEEEDDE